MSNPKTANTIPKYGLAWPANTHPMRIELAMYCRNDLRAMTTKGHSKWEHFRNAIKMHLPEKNFAWHRWVDDFGEEWCEGTQINVWGAGGTTKSGIVGAFCYFDLMAEPSETLTVMVTNPQEKHWDRCFSKTLAWRAALPEALRIGKVVQSPKPALLTVDIKEGSRRGILCISIDKGETGQEIGKKVGAHAPRTRLILEEGQTLPKATLDIATNLFMGSTDKKEAIIGNPMEWEGNALGEASKPMSGDIAEIHRLEPNRWLSRRTHGDKPGVTLVFDGLRCPTNDSPEEAKRLSFMIQPADIRSAREIPGAENSVNFWSQIRGRIPPAGQITTVFKDLDWESCNVAKKFPWTEGFEVFGGADLSLGGDKIPVYRFGIGQTAQFGKVAQKLSREYITVNITQPNRTKQIAVQFAQMMQRWGVQDLKNIAADCSGQQGAIADKMEEECHNIGIKGYLYRVRSEEAVSDRRLSNGRVLNSSGAGETERETAKHRYKDRATELVMNLVEVIQTNCIFGLDDPEVKHQLCSRGFDEVSLEGGATKIQKKKEWKEANSGKSPDELDAVCVFLALVLEKKVLVPGKDTRRKAEQKPSIPTWMIKRNSVNFSPRSSAVAKVMGQRG